MQIRQASMNPGSSPGNGLRNVRQNFIVRGGQGQQRQQHQQQRRPVNLSEMSCQNKTILIRRQLLLMLHARMCTCENLIHQRENPNTPRPRCDMPHCELLKTVLNHMKGCTLERDCTVVHCSSSRKILSHWKNCANNTCQVCPARLKPTNYGITTTVTNDANRRPNPIAQGRISVTNQVVSPIFERNLNRFQSILHAEMNILSASFEAVENGESPTVSSTTGEIIPCEE